MPGRTELQVIGSATEIAEERLANGDALAVETNSHKDLHERLLLISGGARPDRRPKTFAFN